MIGMITALDQVSLEPQALLTLLGSSPPTIHPLGTEGCPVDMRAVRARAHLGECQAAPEATQSAPIEPRGTFAAGSPFRWVVEKAASHSLAIGV
jgi:hypothetical protein